MTTVRAVECENPECASLGRFDPQWGGPEGWVAITFERLGKRPKGVRRKPHLFCSGGCMLATFETMFDIADGEVPLEEGTDGRA